MLNARIGGTCLDVENREAAWRIVPSPPKVAVRSILFGRIWESERSTGELRGGVYIGNGSRSWREAATAGSRMKKIDG